MLGGYFLIEFMQGKLLRKGMNFVIIQIGGIAYRISVSAVTMDQLPLINEEVILYTYLHIREDEISLFGFIDEEEKTIFTTLLTVSGIGPKLALTILSQIKVDELKRAIIFEDIAPLTSVTGVGKKTAERIILELKDKIGKQEIEVQKVKGKDSSSLNARSEALSALIALGYSQPEAQKAIAGIKSSDKMITVEELIRQGLKKLAK